MSDFIQLVTLALKLMADNPGDVSCSANYLKANQSYIQCTLQVSPTATTMITIVHTDTSVKP